MGKIAVIGQTSYPLSPALRVGDLVYVSGQVPVDASGQIVEGGIREQTAQVLENIQRLLAEAGATRNDVVKTTVFLENVRADFQAMNEVYSGFFTGIKPTRSTIGAQLAIDALVEIEAVAYAPKPERQPRE